MRVSWMNDNKSFVGFSLQHNFRRSNMAQLQPNTNPKRSFTKVPKVLANRSALASYSFKGGWALMGSRGELLPYLCHNWRSIESWSALDQLQTQLNVGVSKDNLSRTESGLCDPKTPRANRSGFLVIASVEDLRMTMVVGSAQSAVPTCPIVVSYIKLRQRSNPVAWPKPHNPLYPVTPPRHAVVGTAHLSSSLTEATGGDGQRNNIWKKYNREEREGA
ncbi:hypothetical protein C8F01DRAFT_1234899 [Mycena amicta]|nr:hypothetical protein C8F01DRAFT_1234899 [Mycena amicta]